MATEFVAMNFDQQMQDAIFKRKDDSGFPPDLRSQIDAVANTLRKAQEAFDLEVARVNKVFVPDAREGEIGHARDIARQRIDEAAVPIIEKLERREIELSARLVPAPVDMREKTALIIETRARLREKFGKDLLMIAPIYLEACRVRDQSLLPPLSLRRDGRFGER